MHDKNMPVLMDLIFVSEHETTVFIVERKDFQRCEKIAIETQVS
jgi:hypothetical protein